MTNTAIQGKFSGTKLKKLPVGVKMQWQDWRELYPDTKVLSVDGKEDSSPGYTDYFDSDRSFRGIRSKDRRLQDKELVFTFELEDKNYVIPVKDFLGGKVFSVGKSEVFLFRPERADLLYSTVAYHIEGDNLRFQYGSWQTVQTNCIFFKQALTFECEGDVHPQRLKGFDTFWYTLSLTKKDIEFLR
jgi:hypothetical protein